MSNIYEEKVYNGNHSIINQEDRKDANDETGKGNNGTLYGANLTTDRFGKTNCAYNFNGTSAYIDINTAFFNNGWQEYTISGWLNCGNINQYRQIMFNTHPSTGVGLVFNHSDASSPKRISYYVNSQPGVATWDIFTYPNNISNYNNFIIVKRNNHIKLIHKKLQTDSGNYYMIKIIEHPFGTDGFYYDMELVGSIETLTNIIKEVLRDIKLKELGI